MTDPAIQELLDKAAIRDAMVRYSRGIDRHDSDMIAASFTPDAHVNYGGWEDQGADNIARRLQVRIGRYDAHTHFMGDQEIQLNGDSADVETYAIIYIVYTVEGTQYISTGGIHYEDRMVRYDGEWRVQNRVVHGDWRRKTRVDDSIPGADRLPIYE